MCYSGLMAGLFVGLIIFFFGACVGSFLNVVVYRLNHNLSPLKGRSFCPKCKKKILWRDNIPLISFILLRGRCRFCHSPIGWQYPLVELGTGIFTYIVFRISYLAGGDILFTTYYMLITYALIALFVSDFHYQTIPDEIVYPAIGLAFLFHLGGVAKWSWLNPTSEVVNPMAHLGGVFLAGLGAAAFFWLLVFVTRGKGMGMGDVKLAGLMGLILGYPKIIVALMLAFLTGALVGAILVIARKRHFREHIPFGPFLTGTTWISLFWGQTIWQFYVEKFFLS